MSRGFQALYALFVEPTTATTLLLESLPVVSGGCNQYRQVYSEYSYSEYDVYLFMRFATKGIVLVSYIGPACMLFVSFAFKYVHMYTYHPMHMITVYVYVICTTTVRQQNPVNVEHMNIHMHIYCDPVVEIQRSTVQV